MTLLRREDATRVQKWRKFCASRPRPPAIPETVDTFETRRPSASPKVTTVLRFALIFGADACGHTADTCRTLANACERLRTLRTDFASTPNPQTPNLKTRTLPLRIREKARTTNRNRKRPTSQTLPANPPTQSPHLPNPNSKL